MWPERRNDYKRFPRKRVPPRGHRSDGNHKVGNTAPKKSPLLNTAGEGSYGRYYSDVDYRNYDGGRSFCQDRRSAVSLDQRGALPLDRRGAVSQDQRSALPLNRSALSLDRRSTLSLDRRSALSLNSLNRRSALSLDRRSALSQDQRSALSLNRGSALSLDRRSALSLDRRGALSQDQRSVLSLNPRSAVTLDPRSAVSLDPRSAVSLDRRSAVSLDRRSALALHQRSALPQDQRSALSLDRRSALSLDRRSAISQDQRSALSLDRRRGPPHRGAESGNRWPREDHSTRRKPDYGDMREGARRKSSYTSDYVRGRSRKRDTPFLRQPPVGQKDSPHSRSHTTVGNRSYSLERSNPYSFQQPQHRKSTPAGASYQRQNEEKPGEGKETPVQSSKTSRHTSSSSAVASSKVLDIPSQLTTKELPEAASKWAAEKLEKADEGDEGASPEIAEYESGPKAPLLIDQPEEPESNATHGKKLFEDILLTSRSKAIAFKTKEIEQAYRQDCETFGMVVKMLVEKDPSLEKHIQFALRRNLQEIGERCIQELKRFIEEYDASIQGASGQDFGGPC
ncbi:periphilin-1-like [Talpa occidentalis]|uniref:periphilin-1-like n=1 Tax=Talpa occidentalis TaxID=50954 RepID=UPI00188DD25A|nr:periphilin-1-like [Talpa occidentalis]